MAAGRGVLGLLDLRSTTWTQQWHFSTGY